MQIIAQYIIHNVFIKRSIKMFAAVNSLHIKGQIKDVAHVGHKYIFISHILTSITFHTHISLLDKF